MSDDPELLVLGDAFCGDLVLTCPRPGRHSDIIRAAAARGIETPVDGEQGFLLSDGRFARRMPALTIARAAGQTLRETAPAHGLFSEDVW